MLWQRGMQREQRLREPDLRLDESSVHHRELLRRRVERNRIGYRLRDGLRPVCRRKALPKRWRLRQRLVQKRRLRADLPEWSQVESQRLERYRV
jgi:hypothetical protein